MDDRLRRERDFHNQRFANDSVRVSKVGRFYEINSTILKQYRQFLFQNCETATVLEYGCGTKSIAFELAKCGANVTAIDISQVAIDQAITKSKQEQVEQNVTFRLMNAESLDFDDETFDLICGTGILHHLELEKAMSEIRRVLRPKGKAVFIEPLGHNVLINVFRRFTPEIRSSDEHPLLKSDLALLANYFENVNISYFYFATLIAALFVSLPNFSFLLGLLESVDEILFKFAFFRTQAWQVLLKLSAPIK